LALELGNKGVSQFKLSCYDQPPLGRNVKDTKMRRQRLHDGFIIAPAPSSIIKLGNVITSNGAIPNRLAFNHILDDKRALTSDRLIQKIDNKVSEKHLKDMKQCVEKLIGPNVLGEHWNFHDPVWMATKPYMNKPQYMHYDALFNEYTKLQTIVKEENVQEFFNGQGQVWSCILA